MYQIFWWIICYLVSAALTPKPKVSDAAVANSNDTNFPLASATARIPVVWGKTRLRQPNVIWYGDFRAVPIIKTQSGGLFHSDIHQTVGYRYYWGQQLLLCHGEVTLYKVWASERVIWGGSIASGLVALDIPFFYGGDDRGGGYQAVFVFYPGSNTQVQDPYLTQMLGVVPAYRGVAHIVWYGPSGGQHTGISYQRFVQQAVWSTDVPPVLTFTWRLTTFYNISGYIGTSPTPQPLSFEVSRYPHQLYGSKHIIGVDSNPAEIIYELLTTDVLGADGTGLGLSPSMIDIAAFNTASDTLYAEGFGLSHSWNQASSVEDLIEEFCKIIDAVCYRDFRTGLYTIKLIRGGYAVGTLPVLDQDNIISVDSFTQASIEGTTNEVKLTYLNRSRGYTQTSIQAQDLANMRTQSDINSQTVTYLPVTIASLADRIANRELLALSTPLASAEVIVNREAYAYGPGDLFVLNWPDLGFTNLVMRVMKSAIGMPTANQIRLSLIQDIFALNATAYTDGNDTDWTEPILSPAIVTLQKIIELPYGLNSDESYGKVLVTAGRPNQGCVTYACWEKETGSGGDYASLGNCQEYTPTSTTIAIYPITKAIDESGTLELTGTDDITLLMTHSEDAQRQGAGLFYWAATGEWCSYSTIEYVIGGTYKVYGVWRGLFGTVPTAHALGERIYFIGGGCFFPEGVFDQTDNISVKICPSGPLGTIALTSATAMTLLLTGVNKLPIPPGRILVNNLMYPTLLSVSADVTWEHRNRLTDTGLIVRQDDLGGTSAEGTYTWQLLVNGVVKETASGLTSKTWARGGPYTAAQRIQDDANGNHLVEIQIRQTNAFGNSVYNTSGLFQMTGFGMCFGQHFGGV
jgi:hypothetical protein